MMPALGARLELVAGDVVDLVGGHRIDHVGVADAAVLREGLRLVRVDGEGHPVCLPRPCDRLQHGGPVGRVGEPLTIGSGEHDARRRSTRARVLLMQEVLGALGFGAGDLELARELSAEGGCAGNHESQHRQPAEQDLATVVERPAAKSIQVGSHVSLRKVGLP
jgi:hypothetical protein